jgi:hypothetical protein
MLWVSLRSLNVNTNCYILASWLNQWLPFRAVVLFPHIYIHHDTSPPMQLFFQPRFMAVDSKPVRILIKCYANQLCGETSIDLRMGGPAPVTNLDGLSITLIETQRKAAINATF